MIKEIVNSQIFIIILTISLSWIFYKIIKFIISKSIGKVKESDKIKTSNKNVRRGMTIAKLVQNLVKYISVIICVLIILNQLGMKVETILTSLGALTLVFSLAFQDIIKDFLAGIFIMIDNEFFIGEIIQIGLFKGEVIEIGLRNTRLRNNNGEIKIIANRNITDVTNFSISDSMAIIDLILDNKITEKHLVEIINKLNDQIRKINDVRKSKIIFYGVQQLNENEKYTYRIGIPCKAGKKINIEREFLRIIKEYSIKNNLKIESKEVL